MLSNADNALLTDTDAGTPMGELFRRFWLPVALSEDLPTRDCPPLRLRIMGEDLVAFRATDGNIGLVCGYCPHRGAPLFFGRNEENGLRCVYHGWKFDILGRCIDLPNSPEGQSVKSRVSVRSYPCVEAADLVWAYLGPADKRPPFPEFEWIRLPKTHRYVRKHYLQCNYMQSMEGDFDPSHGAFLHMTLDDMGKTPTHALGRLTNTNNASKGKWLTNPRVFGTLEDTENAVLCLTDAELEDGKTIATAAPIWLMPIFATGSVEGTNIQSGNFRIPIDNSSLIYFRLRWSYAPIPPDQLYGYEHGGLYFPKLIPGTFMPQDNRANDYNLSRLEQQLFSFSGIRSFPSQDAAMVENQRGPLVDRSKEHLTAADAHLINVRARLIRAAILLRQGSEPLAPWNPQGYRCHFESYIAPDRHEAIRQARTLAKNSRHSTDGITLATPVGRV